MTLERRARDSRDALMAELAEAVAGDLRRALAARGRASLAVPGGTTPAPFLEALSRAPLDWSGIAVTLTDERWLPPDHERSNQRLVTGTLLRDGAAAAGFVPLYGGGAAPEESLSKVAAALEAEVLPLDVCVLGMGADRHTASLFPGADRLADALAAEAPPVLALRAPGAPEPRVTLTAPVLRGAAKVYLLITGEAKAAALETALGAGPEEEAPVRTVLRRAGPVEVFYAP